MKGVQFNSGGGSGSVVNTRVILGSTIVPLPGIYACNSSFYICHCVVFHIINNISHLNSSQFSYSIKRRHLSFVTYFAYSSANPYQRSDIDILSVQSKPLRNILWNVPFWSVRMRIQCISHVFFHILSIVFTLDDHCHLEFPFSADLTWTQIALRKHTFCDITSSFVFVCLCWGFMAQSTAKVMLSRSVTH